MTLVVDASVVVAMLMDVGDDGAWAAQLLSGQRLVAPHLLPAEVTSVLRRTTAAGLISDDAAVLALGDLGRLRVRLFAFEPFANRAWELRAKITPYDAWHVALAETLDAPLATLDRRLPGAPGTRCAFRVPAA